MAGGLFVLLFPLITQVVFEFGTPDFSSDGAPIVTPMEPLVAIPVLTCTADPEFLLQFYQTSEIIEVDGDQAFIIRNPVPQEISFSYLVDVSSSSLPYWNLSFQNAQNLQGEMELHFSPVGFGCDTCVLLLARQTHSKCAPLAVRSTVPGQPPPNGYLSLGTFVSGGIGNSPSTDGNEISSQSSGRPELSFGPQSADVNPSAGMSSGCSLSVPAASKNIILLLIFAFSTLLFSLRLSRSRVR